MKMTMTKFMTKTKSHLCLLHMPWFILVGHHIDVDNDHFTRPVPIIVLCPGKVLNFGVDPYVICLFVWFLGLIQETDRLLGQQYNDDTGYYDTVKVSWKIFAAEILAFSWEKSKLDFAAENWPLDYLPCIMQSWSSCWLLYYVCCRCWLVVGGPSAFSLQPSSRLATASWPDLHLVQHQYTSRLLNFSSTTSNINFQTSSKIQRCWRRRQYW